MAPCGNYPGQQWKALNVNNYYKLQNNLSGNNQCLDVVNDASKDKLIMNTCGTYATGQDWIYTLNNNYYKIKNRYFGDNKCLDIINDGQNNKLIMSPCGNYSGQYWVNKV